jgi:hypothetical protein
MVLTIVPYLNGLQGMTLGLWEGYAKPQRHVSRNWRVLSQYPSSDM